MPRFRARPSPHHPGAAAGGLGRRPPARKRRAAAEAELVSIVAAQLDRRPPGAKAAVVARRPGHPGVALLRSRFPAADVIEVVQSGGLGELHLRMAAYGPFSLVVDLVPGPRRPSRRFSRLLFHTEPGGALVMPGPRQGGGRHGPQLRSFLDRLDRARRRTDVSEVRFEAKPSKGRQRARHSLAALAVSVRQVEAHEHHVVAVNGTRALAVVAESELNALLSRRNGRDRVLTTVPGVTWSVRCSVASNSEERLRQLPSGYAAPELSVREYHDVVCCPGQVAFGDNIVLPDSYRHNFRARLVNRGLVEWTPGFVRAPEVPERVLPGSWFYLDSEYRGHFGHALTEQMSRSWGWAHARAHDPATKALVFLNRGRRLAEWEYELWAAAGIDRSDIVLVEEPTRVETLVGASPMFAMPGFVHPAIAETYARVGSALARRAGTGPWPPRIFVSRRIQKRACRNSGEVEALFAAAGFHVVHPEDHPLADQVELFRRAEVIAGFAGSNMFHIGFTGGPKRVILISSDFYRAQNEYMMAAVVGHQLTYVVSSSGPVPRVKGSRDLDYRFDMQAEGVYLREILGSL